MTEPPSTGMKSYQIIIPNVWPFVQPIMSTTENYKNVTLLPEVSTLAELPKDIASAVYGKLYICV
jgi:hypothetical protein